MGKYMVIPRIWWKNINDNNTYAKFGKRNKAKKVIDSKRTE